MPLFLSVLLVDLCAITIHSLRFPCDHGQEQLIQLKFPLKAKTS